LQKVTPACRNRTRSFSKDEFDSSDHDVNALMLPGTRPSETAHQPRNIMRIAQFAFIMVVTVGCFSHGPAVLAQANDAPMQDLDGVIAESIMSSAACQQRLADRHVTFSFTPPVAEGDCAIPLPVRLRSLAIGADDIPFSGEPMLDCRMAEQLADWIGNVVAPLARHHLGSGLAAVETGPGYVCRNRNNDAAGKLSEHARGNALDIFAFGLNDGRRVAVRPADQPSPADAAFLAAVRMTACGYFLTVLGPGSDAAHAEHLHLDLRLRGRTANYRICE
jgi:hypothetical protein